MANGNNQEPDSSSTRVSELNVFQRFEGHVQGKTLGGLIELVPLLVSAVVLLFIIRWADQFIRPLAFVSGRPWDFPGIGIIVGIVIFYLVGLLISTSFGRTVMTWKNAVLEGIPVVKTIYGVTQQATQSMTSQFRFTRAVFLEWPREGMVAIGFVTGRAYRERRDVNDADEPQSLVVVYIPTVPNPTSGNLAFLMEDDLIETDLTVEDAMKLVFSGGIVLPDSISMARMPRVRSDAEFIDRFVVDPR
jgi:uncharacterized membrane protein